MRSARVSASFMAALARNGFRRRRGQFSVGVSRDQLDPILQAQLLRSAGPLHEKPRRLSHCRLYEVGFSVAADDGHGRLTAMAGLLGQAVPC